MGTGLSAVRTYRGNMEQLYAADAGIQKGIWRIKSIIDTVEAREADYSEELLPFIVNGNSVVVNIGYAWVLDGIVNPIYGPHNAWLAMETHGFGESTGIYTLQLVYVPASGANKKVDKIGVWLPNGFEYVAGSCSDPEFAATNITDDEPEILLSHGGTNLTWDISPNQTIETAAQRFRFTPVGKVPRGDIAWVQALSSDIGLSWDNLIWNYTLVSTATSQTTGKSTVIEAHVTFDTGASSGATIIDYLVN